MGLRQLWIATLISLVPILGIIGIYFALRGLKWLARGGPTPQTRGAAAVLLWTALPNAMLLTGLLVFRVLDLHRPVAVVVAALIALQVGRLITWVILGRGLCLWATSRRLVSEWNRFIVFALVAAPVAVVLNLWNFVWDGPASVKLMAYIVTAAVSFEFSYASYATYRLFQRDLIPVTQRQSHSDG